MGARAHSTERSVHLDPRFITLRRIPPNPPPVPQAIQLRFTQPNAMEEWLTSAPHAHPHRHFRCTCCLEWVHTEPVRCEQCQQPLHRACAKAWLSRSHVCPVCRHPWRLKPTQGSEGGGEDGWLKGT